MWWTGLWWVCTRCHGILHEVSLIHLQGWENFWRGIPSWGSSGRNEGWGMSRVEGTMCISAGK